MATSQNTRKSNRRTAISTATASSNDPLGEEQELMKRVEGLFRLEKETWAEFYKFIAEQGPAIIKERKLEEEDLDGGLGIAAWFAFLAKDSERKKQPHVDAAIQYLDASISA